MTKITRLLVCCCVLVLSVNGCSWDSGTYEEFVKNDRVTKCEGICLKDEAISEESCKGDGLMWNKANCTDPTGMIEGIDHYLDEGACINAGGIWAEASCEVTTEFGCYQVKGEWTRLAYELLDLGNGNYIRKVTKDGDNISYICGLYNAVVTEKNAEPCQPDMIEKFKRALEYHLCTANASNCVHPLYIPKENSTLSANSAMCSECPSGMAQCPKDNKYQCVDLMSDTMNCGSCGNNCDKELMVCDEGICRPKCNANEIYCEKGKSWSCLNPADTQTCGATNCEQKGTVCLEGEKCVPNNDNITKYSCQCLGEIVPIDEIEICIDSSSNSSCGANKSNSKGIDCPKGTACKLTSEGKYKCMCSDASELTCFDNDDLPVCIDKWSDKYCGAKDCNNLEEFRCSPSEQCNHGVCVCREGFAHCNGECVDPWNSSRYCGAKGNCSEDSPDSPDYKGESCGARRICNKSRCECDEAAGYIHITRINPNSKEDICVHPSDNDYCGFIASAQDIKATIQNCSNGKVCHKGDDARYSCQCINQTVECEEDGVKQCIDPKSNSKHCGVNAQCQGGMDCTQTDEVCVNGKCSKTCPEGQVMCVGKCISISDYAVNESCTACTDNYCPSESSSDEFTYEQCKREFDSIGREITVTGSRQHCGATCNSPTCGVNTKCMQDQNDKNVYSCQCIDDTYTNCSGNCLKLSDVHMTKCDGEDKCEPGWGDCDNDIANGCETPLDSTVEHCGACKHSCSEIATNAYKFICENSSCEITKCNALFDDCDNNAENGCETELTQLDNCGACNNQCREKHVCSNGVCCLEDNINTTSIPSKCCTSGAHVWKKTEIGLGYYEYIYRCSKSDPSYWNWPWDYEQWEQID